MSAVFSQANLLPVNSLCASVSSENNYVIQKYPSQHCRFVGLPIPVKSCISAQGTSGKKNRRSKVDQHFFFRFIVLALSRFKQTTQPMHIRSALS